MVPLEGEKKPVAYVQSDFANVEGRFSPDTRFVAYSSSTTGMQEIYVRPFPDASGGRWMVSKGGGTHPRWTTNHGILKFRLLAKTEFRDKQGEAMRDSLLKPGDQVLSVLPMPRAWRSEK